MKPQTASIPPDAAKPSFGKRLFLRLRSIRRLRLILAAALSPVLASLIAGTIYLAFLDSASGDLFANAGELLSALLVLGVLGVLIGWPVMMIAGIPFHMFVYKRRRTQIGWYLAGGAAAGILPLVLLATLVFGPSLGSSGGGGGAGPVLGYAAFCLGTGFLSGLFFWLIRRPDLTLKKAERASVDAFG